MRSIRFNIPFGLSPRLLTALSCIILLAPFKMPNDPNTTLPRNLPLPLFNPHVDAFVCEVEATKGPLIDAQADAWFLEARAMERADIYEGDRDYKKIVQLTRQAAERRHWQAMLNLASLYIERRDPLHGVEDAVRLVEDAIRLNVPAAYDRMGTFFMNGTGVNGSATRAYAFWQKAAQMGNPQSQAYLGERLDAGTDHDVPGYWANIPIGIKMMECAFGQGYGPAAYDLQYLYASPSAPDGTITGPRTRETKARALKMLHDGVKLGCMDCARAVTIEFARPFDLARMLAPFVDKARGERYDVIHDALEFDPSDRFPNLDRVVPLPPAILPPWNGDRRTLLNGARGVSHPPKAASPTVFSQRSGRFFLDAAFLLRATGETTAESYAPFAGYWQPRSGGQPVSDLTTNAHIEPGLYRPGEAFDPVYLRSANGKPSRASNIVWEYWTTVRRDPDTAEPPAPEGWLRELAQPNPAVICRPDAPCPATGVWQPWVRADHPMSAAVNQYWRQAWVVAGTPFPQPQQDWLLNLPARDITWHLMDDRAVDIISQRNR